MERHPKVRLTLSSACYGSSLASEEVSGYEKATRRLDRISVGGDSRLANRVRAAESGDDARLPDPAGPARPLGQEAPGQSRRIRHRGRPAHPRRRRDEGALVSVDRRVSARRQHAGHRTRRPAPHHPQRRARPEADCGRSHRTHARNLGRPWRRPRLHGRRPPSAIRPEQVPLHLLHEADRRQARDDGDRARQVGRQRADRDEGRLRR